MMVALRKSHIMSEDKAAYVTRADAAERITSLDEIRQARSTESTTLAPLVGCMTGETKTVTRLIRRGAFSNNDRIFLDMLKEETFGKAGWHQQAGDSTPGASCCFDLAVWARELEWAKPNVCRMRDRLASLRVITYEPDMANPGRGRISWNLATDEWTPLDDQYRRSRYARPGAGRPRSNPAGVITQITEHTSVINGIIDSKHSVINGIDFRAQETILVITGDGHEASGGAVPDETLRMGTEEEIQTEASASGLDAFAPALSGDTRIGLPIVHPTTGNLDSAAVEVPAKPDKPKRRRTPRQGQTQAELDTNDERAAYITRLLDALKGVIGFKGELPEEKRERLAARWFLKHGANGDPCAIADVAECYHVLKGDDFWKHQPVGVAKLARFYIDWQRDPAAFREAHLPKAQRKPAYSAPLAVVTPAAASTTSTIPTIKTNLNPERFAAEAAAKARQKARQEAH